MLLNIWHITLDLHTASTNGWYCWVNAKIDFIWKALNLVIESSSIALRLRTKPWIQFPRPEGQGLFFLGPCHAPRMSVPWEQRLLSPVSRRMPRHSRCLIIGCHVNNKVNKVAWASTLYPILPWCLKYCISGSFLQVMLFQNTNPQREMTHSTFHLYIVIDCSQSNLMFSIPFDLYSNFLRGKRVRDYHACFAKRKLR